MSKEVRSVDPQLAENLRIAKGNLAVAKKAVEDAEIAVYNAAVAVAPLPEKGTIHVTGVKIATSVKEDWDDEALAVIEQTWQQTCNLAFPFKKTYKADAKAVSYIREHAESAYKILAVALTVTPKKPAFTLEGEKE